MKKYIVAALLVLSACGRSSVDSELVGQVKKVIHNTPVICPDYYTVDISLGVMRNGVGSMSTRDEYLTVSNPADVATLQKLSEVGGLVKVKYDVYRFVICTDDHHITTASALE